MTANGSNWKFKNRVKKMLAEKLDGDPNSGSKTRKKVSKSLEKTFAGVLKRLPVEEIVLTADETTSYFVRNNKSVKVPGKRDSGKMRARSDLKRDLKQESDDNIEILRKKNGREKRARIESAKNGRQEIASKKRRTNFADKRSQRKILAPKGPLNLINELNRSDDEGDESSEDGNEPVKTTFPESSMKFGVPTIIRGSPATTSKWPLSNSPVSSLNPSSTKLNLSGNFLSSFFRNLGSTTSATSESSTITAEAIDDLEAEDTEDVEEDETEVFHEIRETRDTYSDVSFITDDEESDPNTDFELADAVESENGSTLKPEFYSLQNKVIAIMGPSARFYFNGKMRIKVLAGKVEIYGFVFSKRETVVPAEVYSPRGSSLVSVETRRDYADETGGESLYDLLTNEGINRGVATDVENRLQKLPAGRAVLILENLENTLTKYLDFYCRNKLFPRTEDSTTYRNRHPKKAEKLLQSIFQYDDSGKRLKKDDYRESNIMKKIVDRSSSGIPQRILIAGGKGVGKSTTLRYFVNGLLAANEEIVVVDFDPGQPEFTPPSCISVNIIDRALTGPNYTHLKTPFYQIFVGDVNVSRCVTRYVQAAKKLVQFLNESPRLRGLTVLVNTMGFCEGIGLDLMFYIIKLVHPSTVVQITSERAKNNFRYLLSSEVINEQSPTRFTGGESELPVWEVPCDHELHVVPSLAEGKGTSGDVWQLEAPQLRQISLLAYLSQIPKDDEQDGKFLFSELPQIHDTVPYSVPMSKLTISLIRTIVPASHILATMNAKIVALCGIDDDTSESNVATDDFYPKTLLRPPVSTCYGFGIVRGVDMENGNVFINTPLSSNELKYVNSLIGSIPLPTCLISSGRRNTPYVGEGADLLPTSREPRRGYFRMRPTKA